MVWLKWYFSVLNFLIKKKFFYSFKCFLNNVLKSCVIFDEKCSKYYVGFLISYCIEYLSIYYNTILILNSQTSLRYYFCNWKILKKDIFSDFSVLKLKFDFWCLALTVWALQNIYYLFLNFMWLTIKKLTANGTRIRTKYLKRS